jgi:hypothetical protein
MAPVDCLFSASRQSATQEVPDLNSCAAVPSCCVTGYKPVILTYICLLCSGHQGGARARRPRPVEPTAPVAGSMAADRWQDMLAELRHCHYQHEEYRCGSVSTRLCSEYRAVHISDQQQPHLPVYPSCSASVLCSRWAPFSCSWHCSNPYGLQCGTVPSMHAWRVAPVSLQHVQSRQSLSGYESTSPNRNACGSGPVYCTTHAFCMSHERYVVANCEQF